MRYILLLSLLMLFTVILRSQPGWRNKEMEVKVDLPDRQAAQKLYDLHLNGDIYPNRLDGGYEPCGWIAVVYVIPPELEKIDRLGLHYEIVHEDMNAHFKDFWVNRDAYHTYQQIIDLADSLSENFPLICHKYLFGTSIQGRQLAALKISDNVTDDGDEPEVLFDGGIHGDEIGGSENLIRFARDLCLAYGVDPYITDLIDHREIWLYLMVNPDGRANMTRENAAGIDLNRNWGYMWDAWDGCNAPFTEPESRGLRECLYTLQPVVYTSYHSGTEFLAYPWSYRPNACPDEAHLHHLAQIYSTTSGYAGLPYEQGYTGMYPINGSSKDAAYGVMGAVSWTIEISNMKQPPASQIALYYNYNKPAMLAMIEEAGYGLAGTVTDAASGAPVTAIVFVDDYYPAYTDPTAGDYHKYVLPGTYTVRVTANGYAPQTVSGVTVTAGGTTVTDFQLEPEESHTVYKLVACQIPGNNFSDEGNTTAILGLHDNVNYSIGKNGWLIVDMQTPVADGPGEDITVYEGDTSPEGYTCYAGQSMDGPWILLGAGTGTTGFDLMNAGIVEVQFFRIVDDGDGQATAPDAGFDLDAIEAAGPAQGVYIALCGYAVDDETGNGNGRIDPGETVGLTVTLRNNGNTTAFNTTGALTTTAPFITVTQADASFGDLAQGQTAMAVFSLTANALTPQGYNFSFLLTVTANEGSYSNSYEMPFTVGQIVENWETGDFSLFDWQQGGNAPWFITGQNVYEGDYCVRSGGIDDLQTSMLDLTLDVVANGSISFYGKVSSETGYDFLQFYIDDSQMGQWSGEQDWALYSYPVTTGTHTFKWIYDKDISMSSGYDCGWVDLITMPPVNPVYMGVVTGTVTDSTTGLPIAAASVGGVTMTNEQGHYVLSLSQGNYDLCAFHPSYDTLCLNAVILDDDTTQLDFALLPVTCIDEPPAQTATVHWNPNPFTSSAVCELLMQENGFVNIEIFDINGIKVVTLFNGVLTPGMHTITWDGTDDVRHSLNGGIYFYRIILKGKVITGKLLLL